MIISPWRSFFWGTNSLMNTTNNYIPRVFLNNAATPQIAKPVTAKFDEMLYYYSYDNEPNSISERIKYEYENVRNIVLNYIDGDPDLDIVIYTPTTTHALNLFSFILLQEDPDQVIITTRMDHIANYLPFKEKFKTVLVKLTSQGEIDMDDYERLLIKYNGKVKLVTTIGASNITGVIPPYYKMASLAHKYGAKILLDAVQLVQHKPFSMKPHSDPEHIDFISFDGHKCYTGQSGGVLIGPKSFFNKYKPMIYGAGIADFVSDSKMILRDAPVCYEAGYPDLMGIISLGESLNFLKDIGLQHISHYEEILYHYLIKSLKEIPRLTIYGPYDSSNRLPYVFFNLDGVSFRKLGDILGFEYGIAITSSTSGANIYVQDLLGLTNDEAYELFKSGEGYGAIRATIALFNNSSDIDRLVNALENISRRR